MRRISVFIIVLTSLLSCKKDAEKKVDPLIARWDVESATRDAKPTKTLTGLYFEFKSTDSVYTNVMGSATNLPYSKTDDLIKIWRQSDTIAFQYHFEDSVLHMDTNMGGTDIGIVLQKEPTEKTDNTTN